MRVINFKTIGIGVTFSPNLEANINEAARLALFFGSKLVLIHVGEASEEKLNKFVLSSNQTLIWDSLNAIGYKNNVEGFGKLFNS